MDKINFTPFTSLETERLTLRQITFECVSGGYMLEEVRQLFIEYAQTLDINLDFQDFETELKILPGKYAPPDGVLLLASVDGKSAGCIALRKLSDDICEMKRLYVRDAYRGSGIGRRLIGMLIAEAEKLNYQYMRLDTLATMKDAQNLYLSFGFRDIEPYVYNPIGGARFLELELSKYCTMKQVYAPGCALMIYKPELAGKVLEFLNKDLRNISEHLICCKHEPNLERGTQIINTCAGCDRRYRELYEGISTVSLWEILAESKTFPFPDYNGMEMSIHDACPTRTEERVHLAIRKLIERMNIKIIEPKNTRTKSICCGDSFYGVLPIDQVKEQMKKRSDGMPCDNVVVYCVSCIKSMYIGGKKPRYIVDLLFNEDTGIGTFEPDAWHGELQKFIDEH